MVLVNVKNVHLFKNRDKNFIVQLVDDDYYYYSLININPKCSNERIYYE